MIKLSLKSIYFLLCVFIEVIISLHILRNVHAEKQQNIIIVII